MGVSVDYGIAQARFRLALTAAASGAALGVALFGASAVRAQAPVNEAPVNEIDSKTTTVDEKGVEDIIVTARRRNEKLLDVPAAITAVGGETLARYNITNVVDVAKMVPQLLISRSSTGTGAVIYLRGVGSSSLSAGFDQSVSINIDSTQISRGNAIVVGYLDMAQLEVLKGPQALFFGKNSPAGVLSIRTNDPGRDFEGMMRAGYDFDAKQTYGEAVVSGPVSDTLGLRLAVRASRQEGYFRNTAVPFLGVRGFVSPGAINRRGPEDAEISGRLTAVFQPNDAFTLRTKFFGARFRGDPAPRELSRCVGGVPSLNYGVATPGIECRIDRNMQYASFPREIASTFPYGRDGSIYQDTDTLLGSADATYKAGPFSVNSITSYYHNRAQSLTTNGNGQALTTERQIYNAFSQELRLASDFDGPLNLVLGGYYQNSKLPYDIYISSTSFGLGADATGSYIGIAKLSEVKTKTYSVFGEAIWEIVPRLELDAGVRWTRETKNFSVISTGVHPSLRALYAYNRRIAGNFSDDNFSPQATLSYKPTDRMSIYGAYRTGYKSGGYNSSFLPLVATNINDLVYGSEDASGFELGVKGNLFGSRLTVNADVYDYTYKDLQVLVFDALTLSYFANNAGKLKTRGAELETNLDLRDVVTGLQLQGSISYNDAKYGNYIGPCYTGQTIAAGCNLNFATGRFNGQDYGGRRPPRAPKVSGNLGFLYSQPVSNDLVLDLSASGRYSSSFLTQDALRPNSRQGSYAMLDASVRLGDHEQGWEMALIGRNLTNKVIVFTSTDLIATGTAGGTATSRPSDLAPIVQPGRSLSVQFTYNF